MEGELSEHGRRPLAENGDSGSGLGEWILGRRMVRRDVGERPVLGLGVMVVMSMMVIFVAVCFAAVAYVALFVVLGRV